LGSEIRELAGIGGSLRRSSPMVVPERSLSYLHDWSD
jgi:hypothetical protein